MNKKINQKIVTKLLGLKNKNNIENLTVFLPIVYIISISVYMLYHRAWFSPDQFFACAIVAVIFIGRSKQFLKDWIPLLLFLFGYEYLRGIIPFLTSRAHVYPLIAADTLVFGFIPALKFQALLFNENQLQWYDYASVIFYTSHFIVPMVIAFIFWTYDRSHFKKYAAAFLVLSYLAFFTFLIFPAVPPWMASNQGYLPPLSKIMDVVYASFSYPISVPSIYKFFGANLVAAFPSLHAAYPWLIFLFIRKKSKLLSYISLFYVGGVWFSVIYLGEHYVIDVVAGALYSTIAYYIIELYDGKHLKKQVNVLVATK